MSDVDLRFPKLLTVVYFSVSAVVGLVQSWPLFNAYWEFFGVVGWCWVPVAFFATLFFWQMNKSFKRIAVFTNLTYCIYFLWIIALTVAVKFTDVASDALNMSGKIFFPMFTLANLWLLGRDVSVLLRRNR